MDEQIKKQQQCSVSRLNGLNNIESVQNDAFANRLQQYFVFSRLADACILIEQVEPNQ